MMRNMSTPLRERTSSIKGSPSSVMQVPGASSSRSDAAGPFDYSSSKKTTRSSEIEEEPAHQVFFRSTSHKEHSEGLCWDKMYEERNENTLSDLILQRNWADARTRLASASHQHEIQEGIPMPSSAKGSFHALPLHLACALRPLPPASFVRYLISLHPQAAKVQEDTWGMLPLHLAVNMGYKEQNRTHDEFDLTDLDGGSCSALDARVRAAFNQRCIVVSLVEANPGALVVRERFSGMLPIHIAASTASFQRTSLSSDAASILEVLIERCPASVDTVDDWGDTPREIAWRIATFTCLRCRVRGRYIANEHGRCPHVGTSRHHAGNANNPLLKEDVVCHFEMHCADDMKTLTSGGCTETTAMSDDSHLLSSKADDYDDSRDDHSIESAEDEPQPARNTNETVTRIDSTSDWTVTMQIRLESLHSRKRRGWTIRRKPPSPFFEISIQDESLTKRETIYRSYPVMKTIKATWDKIKSLDVKLGIASSPRNLSFRIAVFDCDIKGGNHLLIGEAEVKCADIEGLSGRQVPIKRNKKIKGFLRLVHFELHECT